MKQSLVKKVKLSTNKRLDKLPPYVEDYVFENKDSKQPQTLLAYVGDITLLFEYLYYCGKIETDNFENVPVSVFEELTTRDIQRFLDHVEDYEKTYINKAGKNVVVNFKNNTYGKARKLASIREWFDYLVKEKHIKHNVAHSVKFKVNKNGYIKERLNNDEIHSLFNTVDSITDKKIKHSEHVQLRNKTILTILAYSGIRVSELVQLDIEDISFREETMLVIRKGGKKQKIDLSPKVIKQLEEYMEYRKTLKAKSKDDQNSLFLSMQRKRPTTKTIRTMLTELGIEAGIDFNVTPHVLRRTFGTNHYNQTGDISMTAQVLGHSSSETTKNHYVSIDAQRVKKSIQDFDY